MKNADMPAMPQHYMSLCKGVVDEVGSGLTKREMIAMHIMAGMLADSNVCDEPENVAKVAIHFTDALLTELEET